MNGIKGCKSLTPFSKQMKRVNAALYFSYGEPFENNGLVASK
jgi:hypothetical protein